MISSLNREKVAIIGSGNWGSAIAKIIGQNVRKFPEFDDKVHMWVHEEMVNGKPLTQIINETHENIKYLPGIQLPENVIAEPNVEKAVQGATLLIFVLPHQFLIKTCQRMKGHISSQARAVSLIKGIHVTPDGLQLFTEVIRHELGIDTCVLSGANIASEVAEESFCESTLGYRDESNAIVFQKVFDSHYFRVSMIKDVPGVELCGALKNVVALAAGFVDGLKMGGNTKAAIIRIGIGEMKKFANLFDPDVQDQTFMESCGIADVMTTCYGGRNRKVAEAHVLTGKPFVVLEKELLNGQKLQGTLTAEEVHLVLEKKGLLKEFPLFTAVYEIAFTGKSPKSLFDNL